MEIKTGSYMGLGAVRQQDDVTFCVAAETDEPVFLLLYNQGEQEMQRIPMAPIESGSTLHTVLLEGIGQGEVVYNLEIDGRERLDSAAKLVRGREDFGAHRQIEAGEAPQEDRRSVLPVQESFDWKGDHTLQLPWEEAVAYGLHVRSYTMQRNGRGRKAGTFAALREQIPYWQELGINQIVLMPAYEFDECGTRKMNVWGYGDACYFAPKAAYAAGDRPDVEMKMLVRSLHQAGIELLMEFAFWHSEMSYMAQCLSYWHSAYHIDGFVLMTDGASAQELAREPQLSGVKIIAPQLDAQRIYPTGRRLPRRLAQANDGFKIDMRRMLKSDEGALRSFVGRFRKNGRDIAVMNYMTGHDGFTLADLVSYNQKHNEENGEGGRDGSAEEFSWNCGVEGATRKRTVNRLRMRQMKNAMAMMLLAQGVPYLRGGDEFGNSQQGNNNPYCLDNAVSWVDWKGKRSNKELLEFVQALIAFRKAHPILHRGNVLTGEDTACSGYPDFSVHGDRAWYGSFSKEMRHVGIMECGEQAGQEAYVYMAFNFHWEEQEFALPYLPEGWHWQVALCTAEKQEMQCADHPVRLFGIPGRSICVLEGIKAKEEADHER